MSPITEQIKALKEHADYMQEIGRLFTASVIRHAAEIIEALEQQETCEDAISRENLLLWLDDIKESARKHVGFLLDVQRHVRSMPPVNLRSLNPEADREASKAYCAECDHVEMCSWYPHDGCEWLKTDRYNAGYNAAKREIVLSGEYERAYERGKADAQTKTGHWIRWYEQKETEYYTDNKPHCKCSECGTEYDPYSSQFIKYCNECGAKMVESQESKVEDGNDD